MLQHQNKFVIVAGNRTGSSWLVHLLEQHPEVICFDEVLNDTRNSEVGTTIRLQHLYFSQTSILPTLKPHMMLRAQVNRVAGFKVIYWRLTEQVNRFIEDHNILVIHLLRRNLVDCMLSQLIAKQTKIWHVYNNQGSALLRNTQQLQNRADLGVGGQLAEYNSIRIQIKPSKMWAYFREREEAINYVEGRHRTLIVHYEDLPNIENIYDFLGIERIDIGGAILKQRRVPKSVIITNYDKLVEEFKDTKYQWMF